MEIHGGEDRAANPPSGSVSEKERMMAAKKISGEFPRGSNTLKPWTSTIIVLFAALVRVLVSLGPYSGQGTPPMYGDYEAQRHWMEITLHTPVLEWYRSTSDNNLSYWGLDYPPLTAYQSLAHAFLINSSCPESLTLFSSRGFESYKSKILMRWTVLSSDILVFFPAAVWFVHVYNKRFGGSGGEWSAPWLLAMILLNPCLILIDHGHFQYNCISLGLTLGAVAAILSGHDFIASALFSLAINHKQIFVALLGVSCTVSERHVISEPELLFIACGWLSPVDGCRRWMVVAFVFASVVVSSIVTSVVYHFSSCCLLFELPLM
ncbi:hypothetical protein HPP92_001348 [Vanilla planifolia]|uniref:Alpha-1,3-glucosyltransferase n=1 Tax=Vanilla planifolia TaxID=51239 RepID=A0A835VF95_VANPL|nr:hypothetical protein HPP92_001348 [Vanilla planifolia]